MKLTKLLYKIHHKEVLDESSVRSIISDFYREVYNDPLFEENFHSSAFELLNSVEDFQIKIIPYNPFTTRADRVIYNRINPKEATFEIVDEMNLEKNRRWIYHEAAHLLLAYYYTIDGDIFLRRTSHPTIRGAKLRTKKFIGGLSYKDKKLKKKLEESVNYKDYLAKFINDCLKFEKLANNKDYSEEFTNDCLEFYREVKKLEKSANKDYLEEFINDYLKFYRVVLNEFATENLENYYK